MLRALFLSLFLFYQVGDSFASNQLKLGLIALGHNTEHPFWGPMGDLMEEACSDLGVQLFRYNVRSRYSEVLAAIQRAHGDGVDALVLPNVQEAAVDLLDLVERLEIPTFLVNADINDRYKPQTGGPREKYKYWLGRMLPDDEQAGYLLGKSLIENALRLHPPSSGRKIELAAITGTFVDTPSILRVAGLNKAVAEYESVILNQVVYAQWASEQAYKLTGRLLQRYPEIDAIWTASDTMGLAVMRFLDESGNESGKEIVTGGVDWSTNGIQALSDEHFVASTGGHLLEGAWAAVLLHDYLNGADFSDLGVEFATEMNIFESVNTDLYLRRHATRDWSRIDFRKFSRFLNPEMNTYEFSPRVLFEEE